MKTITGPLPLQFFARCERCGQYPVSEKTVRRFLTEELRKKLDMALEKGAHGAILTFLNRCPSCNPNNSDAEIELAALTPRMN